MNDVPKRRLLDRLGASPTFVADGCRIVGDFDMSGPLVVCGAVRGNARVGAAVSIASTAQWHGDLAARSAVVAGHITGRIHVQEKLEIGATARITGEVSARSIAIARGAVIEGDVRVTSGEPVVQFEERRGGN
jgi:cytoskeletal protein CcmA (bactofilin family)